MLIHCKNKKKPKCILLILGLFLLCLLSGCKSGKTAGESNSNQVTLPLTNEPSVSKPEPIAAEPTNAMGASGEGEPSENGGTAALTDVPKAAGDPRLEDFSEIDKYFKDYTFDVSYDEKLEVYQRSYSIHGSYDLNGDGEADRIGVELKADYQDGSYVEVNGIKVALNPCNPSGEIRIIDLDNRDSYAEIAVFDDGPSGDPAFLFFRYDGKELYSIGSIDRYALMDGKGKFISWFHLANNFKPQFFSAWGEFKDNQYVITNHDVEQNIGKTYEVDGTAYFIPLDKNPEDYFEHTVWDSDAMREFKAEKVKLLDIHISPDDRLLNWFYVELQDGERGLLYFWIGD